MVNPLKNSLQKGFSLLEVLIAFFILSIGLLGIVSLQAMSKKFTHQAAQRSIAVSFADTIIERIRVNPAALPFYSNSAALGGATRGSTEPSPNCSSAPCSVSQLANHDLWHWEQILDGKKVTAGSANTSGLIAAKACINFSPREGLTKTGFLNLRIQWTGLNRLTDAASNETRCGNQNTDPDPFRRQVVVNTYMLDEKEL